MPLVAGLARDLITDSLGLDPPFSPGGMLVGTDDTTIDKMDVPVELAFVIRLLLQLR